MEVREGEHTKGCCEVQRGSMIIAQRLRVGVRLEQCRGGGGDGKADRTICCQCAPSGPGWVVPHEAHRPQVSQIHRPAAPGNA